MEAPPIISAQEALKRLKERERPWASEYLAMYSNQWQGIITDPWLMVAPLDDHLVHRGDGVFEAMKCVAGRIYQMDAHLARLARSAGKVSLALPHAPEDFARLLAAVTRAGGQREAMVRLFVSRGPGGFTTNPFECPEPGVYVAVGRLHSPPPEAYTQGVRIGISRIQRKSGIYATVKTCDYVPNVLLKREAILKDWDYSVGLDSQGFLAEGSTENFALVDGDGNLVLAPPTDILEGTTMQRVAQLAQELIAQGSLAGVVRRQVSIDDLRSTRECMLMGTTLDVLPATRLEGEPIGDGSVGPVAKALNRLLREDILNNPAQSYPVWE